MGPRKALKTPDNESVSLESARIPSWVRLGRRLGSLLSIIVVENKGDAGKWTIKVYKDANEVRSFQALVKSHRLRIVIVKFKLELRQRNYYLDSQVIIHDAACSTPDASPKHPQTHPYMLAKALRRPHDAQSKLLRPINYIKHTPVR